MLKEKGILILKTGELKSTMHYTTFQHKIAIITTKTLKNIPDIKQNQKVELLVGKDHFEAIAEIIDDQKRINTIFNKMLEEKNTYFTTLSDDLIAIEFTLSNE